jgi:Domain of unknown function (DUF4258)
MKKGRWIFVLLSVLLVAWLFLQRLPRKTAVNDAEKTERVINPANPSQEPADREVERNDDHLPESVDSRGGINRNISRIIYTKHARCRMGCRMIDATEVQEILRDGTINYQKSDLRSSPDPKYALEGLTHDGQRVRIVFANSPRGPVVVTVIDLGKEWTCNCK